MTVQRDVTDGRPPEQSVSRSEYCDLVGINERTLRRWINEGVVALPLHQRDVSFGRGVRALLQQYHGSLRLAHAVAIVRGDVPLPEDRPNPAQKHI
jgi:hypothetical protein